MCVWLPPLLTFEQYGNDWSRYLDGLYYYFRQDFVDSQPTNGSKPFRLKRHPLYEGREATFWHLISEGMDEATRTMDVRRCERIRWPRLMIEAIGTERVLIWNETRAGEHRLAVTLPDFSYLVVLAERSAYRLLWTAYCVESDVKRKKLRKTWERDKLVTPF